ncbi:tubulin-folding cofactor B-like isoform X1 [Tigriopus californicus]|uniref:tubulin-folding cofactor B-like isoform X1 n=1 Tax=Tigriopus californicus TaxID=6832 RepID=UPI0027D9F7A8|nr:tubulin-folding cofactor B-like isoform X1 [Tigriopus californicus]
MAYQVVTESLVNVFISSNCTSFTSEKKFAKDLTIADLKSKLELITGASSISMSITVFDSKDNKVCDLDDNAALLGSYHVDTGMRLHVVDTSKTRDEFENLANVEKFEMSKEEYAKRDDTVQSFLKRNRLGKYNEEELKKMEDEKSKLEAEEKQMAEAMKVDDRCEVKAPGAMTRRGTVRFVGQVHFKTDALVPGYWVGVQYDEPLGKNDGSVDGKRYFKCPEKYGGFVKVAYVTVGDFPEEDLDVSEDEM